MGVNYAPLVGLFIGTILKVFVPYIRNTLERMADTGELKVMPFDWRYLAQFLLPVLQFGVAFLTIDGMWETAMGWELIPTIAMAYTGTDIGKEIVKGGMAIVRIAR